MCILWSLAVVLFFPSGILVEGSEQRHCSPPLTCWASDRSMNPLRPQSDRPKHRALVCSLPSFVAVVRNWSTLLSMCTRKKKLTIKSAARHDGESCVLYNNKGSLVMTWLEGLTMSKASESSILFDWLIDFSSLLTLFCKAVLLCKFHLFETCV